MEGLRIQIPKLYDCIREECPRYTREENALCVRCVVLNTSVRQEVPSTTLSSKSKFCHGTPFRRYLCG